MQSQIEFRQKETENTYNFVKPYLNSCRVGLDIGCDVFQFAGQMELDFDHIHCFDFRNKWQQASTYINDLSKITFHHTGLGETADVRYSKPGVGRIKSDTAVGRSTLRVPIVPLDSFGLFENIDFIKIDVEGYEPKILQGAMKTIASNSPVILCEINRGDFTAKEMLEGIGYRCVAVYHKLGIPHDYLFVR